MIDTDALLAQRLTGGFFVAEITFAQEPFEDALGREAVAQTRIVGREFRLIIRSGLTEEELSITLYHEILEAATVASDSPPESVCELNEAGFESAARQAHRIWGLASLENLNRILRFYGFREE